MQAAHTRHQQSLLLTAWPPNTWKLCPRCVLQPLHYSSNRSSCLIGRPLQHTASSRAGRCSVAAGADAQQQPQQVPGISEGQSSWPPGPLRSMDVEGMPLTGAVLPNLGPPLERSPPPGLGWVPPQLLTHVRALLGFLRACWELLPEFVAPSVPEALRRLVLVLAASLAMVVVVSTIDSGWLWLYLLRARRGVVAV